MYWGLLYVRSLEVNARLVFCCNCHDCVIEAGCTRELFCGLGRLQAFGVTALAS
jgi:hypothetical protein